MPHFPPPDRLRKATKKDEQLVTGIMLAAYSQPWTHRHVTMAIENNEVWLAGDDGIIIYEFIPPDCEMKIIAVHPFKQKQGIGRQLLQYMLDDCTAKNIEKIYLEVEESNEAAIALYQNLGFISTSRRENYYGQYRHASLMQLQLGPKPTNQSTE